MNTSVGQNSTMAIASACFGLLLCLGLLYGLAGIASPLSGLAVLFVVVGPPAAIVCGHIARASIRRSQGAMKGDGLAVAGLVLGYVGLAGLLVFLACFGVMSLLYQNGTWKG